jgi:hypothetical protein
MIRVNEFRRKLNRFCGGAVGNSGRVGGTWWGKGAGR